LDGGLAAAPVKYCFGAFEFDAPTLELRCSGEPLEVRRKVLELLRALIENRHRPISRDELLQQVWSDAVVGESALSTTLAELRRALDDTGKRQRIIRTVRGRGYRFVALTHEYSDAQGGVAATAPRPGDFVGRERLLESLGAALESADWGRGQIVLLAGEPGIGKTRTVQEFAAIARARGARVVGGWCYEGEGASAFWPWVQVLRALVASLSESVVAELLGAAQAEVFALLPELRGGVPPPADSRRAGLEESRFRQFDAVTRLLGHGGEGLPLVVVLDDLHWADRPSLRLLEFLAHAISEMHLLVVGTYRPTELEAEPALGRTLDLLARREEYGRYVLDALLPEDAERFVRKIAFAELSDEMVQRIVWRGAGNPFFLRELVSVLRNRRSLEDVPLGVRDAIRQRLERVASCRAVVDIAAVAGMRFELDTVAAAGGLDRGDALDALEQATAAGLLARDEWLAYRFSHALVQETVYLEIAASHRMALHRRLGAYLEARGGGDPNELAHHFREAGDAGRAILYSVRAGEAAMQIAAPEDAVSHYVRALELVERAPEVDGGGHFDLLVRLADAQGADEFEAARDTLLRAVEAARRLRDGVRLARVAIRIADRMRVVRFVDMPADLGTKLLEDALDVLGAEDDRLRVELLTRLSDQYADAGDFERSHAARVGAIELARRSGDRTLEAAALVAHHRARFARVPARDSLVGASEALELADACGAQDLAADAQELRAAALFALGDVLEADAEVERLAQRNADHKSIGAAFFIPNYRMMRHFLAGRFAEAEESILAARRFGGDSPMSLSTAQLIQIRRAQGDTAEFGSILEGLRAGSSPMDHSAIESLLCMDIGREEEARVTFERAMERDFTPAPLDSVWPAKLAILAEVCAYLGDRRRAAQLYEALEPHAGTVLISATAFQCYGTADFALGQLAGVLGLWDAAERHLAAADALAVRMGSPLLMAAARLCQAAVHLCRGEPPRAVALAREALERAEEIGLAPAMAGAREVLRRAGGAAGS
jgi:DNA-binding winged helix-turn-helix (wHTH) protein/tetratricopeptide (TPR) repeat protein